MSASVESLFQTKITRENSDGNTVLFDGQPVKIKFTDTWQIVDGGKGVWVRTWILEGSEDDVDGADIRIDAGGYTPIQLVHAAEVVVDVPETGESYCVVMDLDGTITTHHFNENEKKQMVWTKDMVITWIAKTEVTLTEFEKPSFHDGMFLTIPDREYEVRGFLIDEYLATVMRVREMCAASEIDTQKNLIQTHLHTSLSLELADRISGYIPFLSKRRDDGSLEVFFFESGSHIDALRTNKELLDLADCTDSEASALFYGHDYARGLTGGQIYRDGNGQIEGITFLSNCDTIKIKELRAILTELVDNLPESIRPSQILVRVFMSGDEDRYMRRYVFYRKFGSSANVLHPTMATITKGGETVPYHPKKLS